MASSEQALHPLVELNPQKPASAPCRVKQPATIKPDSCVPALCRSAAVRVCVSRGLGCRYDKARAIFTHPSAVAMVKSQHSVLYADTGKAVRLSQVECRGCAARAQRRARLAGLAP